ncbi:MAG: hypothetical protein HFG09_03165 [Oscillibacter sp.]|nr:hypothetical protein [Oscillibacter sp.]
MSDFMKWLYAHYIRPELEAAPQGEYRAYLSAVWMQTMSREQEDYEKAAEFIALHAFLLGVRTGRGLSDSLRA